MSLYLFSTESEKKANFESEKRILDYMEIFSPIIMTITIDLLHKITYFTEEMTWKQFMTQKRIRSFRMHLLT